MAVPPVPFLRVTDAPTVSAECREEVFQFKISRNSNINANVPLGTLLSTGAQLAITLA